MISQGGISTRGCKWEFPMLNAVGWVIFDEIRGDVSILDGRWHDRNGNWDGVHYSYYGLNIRPKYKLTHWYTNAQ